MDLIGKIIELEEKIKDLRASLTRLVCVGEVVAIDPSQARVRVKLPSHDNLVTDFLPVLYSKTQLDKEYYIPDIGEQVLVLFVPLEGFETGFVLGASYNDVDKVPVNSKDKWHKKFKDGTYMEYDRKEHVFRANIKGDAEINVEGNLIAQVNKNASIIAGSKINLTAPKISIAGDITSTGSEGGVGEETKRCNTNQTGNYVLNGNLTVNGSIFASGDIFCDGSNSNHHSH